MSRDVFKSNRLGSLMISLLDISVCQGKVPPVSACHRGRRGNSLIKQKLPLAGLLFHSGGFVLHLKYLFTQSYNIRSSFGKDKSHRHVYENM